MNTPQSPISRRRFTTRIVLGGIGFFIFGAEGCNTPVSDVIAYDPDKHLPFGEDQFHTLIALTRVLFPEDGNGPGADKINAVEHIVSVVNDDRLDPNENQLIIDRLDSFISFVRKSDDAKFYELPEHRQYHLVEETTESEWGHYWLSRLMTLVFEALLLDPAYHVNTNESGWKWLNHTPGYPRPQKEELYPQIFITHEI